MANKNINNTNLVIGPNTRIEKGEIKQLEINGEDIPLAESVTVIDHLYAWKMVDGASMAYTTTTTPAVGDTAIMADAYQVLITDPISALGALGTDTITAFSTVFERDDTKDIEL